MRWKPDKKEKMLCRSFLLLKTEKETIKFLRDLLTIAEIKELTKRFQIAKLLYREKPSYQEIAKKVGVSTTTVTRVAHWLHHGENGYKIILERTFRK